MRLNKFIASSGGLSRREVDSLITKKLVKVNSTLAALGQIIDENTDKIEVFDNSKDDWKQIENLFDASLLLVHKPIFVSIKKDNTSKIRSISELFPKQFYSFEALYNLNSNTEGLVVLTNIRNFKLTDESDFIIITKEELEIDDFQIQTEVDVTLLTADFREKYAFLKIKGHAYIYILSSKSQSDTVIRKYFQNQDNKIVRLIKIRAGEYLLDSKIYEKKYLAKVSDSNLND